MVMISSVTVAAVLLWFTYGSMSKEAYAEANKDAYTCFNDFDINIKKYAEIDDLDVYAEYYLKTATDRKTVCINHENNKEIYNSTVIDKESLINRKYKTDQEMGYSYIHYSGGEYIIFQSEFIGQYVLYRIEDVSYVKSNIYKLAFYGVLVLVVVLCITFMLLAILLKRQFIPLQRLKDTTKLMADGMYDVRTDVKREDEVGELGKSFNKMAEAVEKRDKNLKLFMGNLTHELKTPMTAISGYAQTMLNVKLSEDEAEEALIYICDECKRLERLSKKLMRLLEIENNGDKLEFREIPVNKLFDETIKTCRTVIKGKSINIECEDDGTVLWVEPDLMTDVLVNLVDNAVKASDNGGKIELTCSNKLIRIRDYGCGMASEELEKIMEPFYMIDKSRSRKSGGAGLGLALSAAILRQHNVKFSIESRPGEGTTVNLQFV